MKTIEFTGLDLTAGVSLEPGPTEDQAGQVFSADLVVNLHAHTPEAYALLSQAQEIQDVLDALKPDILETMDQAEQGDLSNARVCVRLSRAYYEDNPR